MKNKPRFLMWVLPTVVTFISLGCGLAGLAGSTSEPTPTRRVAMLPTFTPTPELIVVQPTPTTEPSPTSTPQPVEPTPTSPPPTPIEEKETEAEPISQNNGPVTVAVNQNMNVRSGPGTNYPVVGTAPAGASSAVVGRNSDSSWLQVEYPPGSSNTAWVFAQLVTVSGNPQNVAVAQVSAPPAPVPQPAAQPESQPPPQPEAPKYQFTPTGWHASKNEAIIHFRGTIRDEGGNAVNGFSVLVDNGSWSVLSHPTGASHHYPQTVNGEWDVVIPDIRTGMGWWNLTVVSYDCPNFSVKFDAQCKQYTRLSEDVKIEVDPNHTIIWADWKCHWDCNKGLYVDAYRP
jgi:uncharacterized protein YraI